MTLLILLVESWINSFLQWESVAIYCSSIVQSNEYSLVPFGSTSNSRPPVMLITNSNVKHSLADSQYPVRVKQCQDAVNILSKKFPHIMSPKRCDVSCNYCLNVPHCVKFSLYALLTAEWKIWKPSGRIEEYPRLCFAAHCTVYLKIYAPRQQLPL